MLDKSFTTMESIQHPKRFPLPLSLGTQFIKGVAIMFVKTKATPAPPLRQTWVREVTMFLWLEMAKACVS